MIEFRINNVNSIMKKIHCNFKTKMKIKFSNLNPLVPFMTPTIHVTGQQNQHQASNFAHLDSGQGHNRGPSPWFLAREDVLHANYTDPFWTSTLDFVDFICTDSTSDPKTSLEPPSVEIECSIEKETPLPSEDTPFETLFSDNSDISNLTSSSLLPNEVCNPNISTPDVNVISGPSVTSGSITPEASNSTLSDQESGRRHSLCGPSRPYDPHTPSFNSPKDELTGNSDKSKHQATRLIACPSCSRTYSRKCDLKKHLTVHVPVQARPFVCTYTACAYRFSTRKDLARHSLIHSPVRSYFCAFVKCKYAQKGFRRKYARDRHVKACKMDTV
ncbi:uncharacterized protein BDZ99DRAFT_571800 [Mytilinidion resinicola]|uniref:C2H2 type master regulator of conidiophore development brlA n=1 Tax=Mytilinidion resinicola TaxID=574789 RepID=A0A6A6YK66_9PEZI|nr:uncharacterized protein BDZ99DRAFT_571800 [Mytilinidion resinicola]KAF2808948.1 hypothetical protein BDZ99DRAFT_571800 [Mytilinidion resinicola]